ncbi:Crp/Fnr family transcriptional regulator [Bosea sp. BK604]|uniref:Crp/Fnr family transcriptional regulator n=1 Tax=Bosea sp. BK604 TaxID=2512180 RepID=UPI001053C9EF|nr:Crp/Fnr family transcriptional regulator [Bosea sp. BK604]TCR68269.1 CRP-like cAMP-binding protein [Bosea sp. BK604]
MAVTSPPRLSALVRKLQADSKLTNEQSAAILALPAIFREFRAGQEVVREGDRPSQCCLILDGLACRFKIVGDGARQIHSYHIVGDIPDLQSLHLARMDHNLACLRSTQVAFITHTALRELIKVHPNVGQKLWRETLIDASIFREWMSNIGRRPAITRIAHVLCELLVRYRAMGLAQDMVIPQPITQTELGDAQGLSTVHVNRSMQELKDEGLAVLSGRNIKILDYERLAEIGDFDPAYLHLCEMPDMIEARAYTDRCN